MTAEEFLTQYREKSLAIFTATKELAELVENINTIEEDMDKEAEEDLLIEMEVIGKRMQRRLEKVVEGMD